MKNPSGSVGNTLNELLTIGKTIHVFFSFASFNHKAIILTPFAILFYYTKKRPDPFTDGQRCYQEGGFQLLSSTIHKCFYRIIFLFLLTAVLWPLFFWDIDSMGWTLGRHVRDWKGDGSGGGNFDQRLH